MNEPNPYQAPSSAPPAPAVGVLSGSLADVRKVAQYQKGINACILLYLLLVVAAFAVRSEEAPRRPGEPPAAAAPPSPAGVGVGIAALAVALGGFVYTVMLATKVYGVAVGILLGLLTLLPCLGLIVLLIINQRATTILKENGFKVGLMGASLADIDARLAATGA